MRFQHLEEKQQSYSLHFKFAFGAGIVLILAGIASIIHAILPNILTSYAFKKTTALARLAKIGRLHARTRSLQSDDQQ